jgi:SAM-dependent methyltransferase
MFFIAAAVFILIIAVIVIFAFPQFSPIPYFPSNMHDMPIILQALHLNNGQTVFDLGAGDGVVIFKAALAAKEKNLNTYFVAVEINPILICILHIRRMLHPNRANIRIVWGDLFKLDYSRFVSKNNSVTAYLYVTPRLIPSILDAVHTSVGRFTAVSYYYSLSKEMKPTYKGIHSVFVKVM